MFEKEHRAWAERKAIAKRRIERMNQKQLRGALGEGYESIVESLGIGEGSAGVKAEVQALAQKEHRAALAEMSVDRAKGRGVDGEPTSLLRK